MGRTLALALAALCAAAVAAAQPPAPGPGAPPPPGPGAPPPPVHALRAAAPITVDGELDEPVWHSAEPVRGFTQSNPNEGATPRERTTVCVAYDDDALYVAALMEDAHPDSIIASLVRRDLWVPSDRLVVYLDPYHDHRSGYFFSVSAAGVLWDGTMFNDGQSDDSWDGVWDARARRLPQGPDGRGGWSCEMRIPFSQLRFRPGREQVWGINVRRRVERTTELDELVWTPKNGSGFTSRFAHLVGIEDGHRSRSVEVTAYSTGKAEYLAHAAGDPLHDGSRYTPGAGGDLRASVGNNLTLNATANPDFGQVEVDPAVVNLSDVESYFQEKRPFFTENSRIFGFGNEGANHYWGFNWPEPRFFYSRRIGRAPQGGVPWGTEFADVPMATRILGAAKLTGKLGPSLNFGTMHAVTAREEARFADGDGLRDRTAVEPLTYYGVARGLKELEGGYNGVGLMTTLAQRSFDGSGLDRLLNRQSLMTGLDGWHFLDRKKMWVLSGWAAMSRVAGATDRMIALQRNSRHYLQRPDAHHLGVDSSATSLTGYGARVWLNKQDGNLISNSAVGYMDPRFDVNDMGYQTQANVMTAHTGLQYHFTKPNRVQREAWLGEVVFDSYDRDGNRTGAGWWQGYDANFANDWTYSGELMFVPRTMNHRRSRGGPLVAELPGAYWAGTLETAGRKPLVYHLGANQTVTPGAGTDYWEIGGWVQWKPVSNFSIQVGPDVQRVIEDAQYMTRVAAPGEVPANFGGSRYVFARMDQTTVAAEIRLNVSFTPNLSLQTYIQPLVSAARFSDFKELARAGSYDFTRYGAAYDAASGVVTPAGGTPFGLYDPSFNTKSLRGNAVLRWEYRPGSVLFFVWTQQRADDEAFGDLNLGRSTRRLFDAEADDILLVKATYHLNL